MEEKKINNISSVCVYCASSTKIPPVYFDAAKELGRLLGERKLRVVNGAGNIGLMCAVYARASSRPQSTRSSLYDTNPAPP